MLNIILNLIGMILIIYSIFVIKKDVSFKENEENNSIKANDLNMDFNDPVEEFDQIIYQKIKNSNSEVQKSNKKIEKNNTNNYDNLIIKESMLSEDDHTSPLHKKIIELKYIGLDNEEIARKLGRGIREIDIIVKVYKL